MKPTMLTILLAAVFAASAAGAEEKRYEPNWESLDQRPTPEWFLDAKFGIFIHWGVYSVPSWGKVGEYAEWYWNKMHDKKPDNVWWQFHKKQLRRELRLQGFRPAVHGRAVRRRPVGRPLRPLAGASTSCPPRSTTRASASGPAPRPARPGAGRGTRSRSARSAT